MSDMFPVTGTSGFTPPGPLRPANSASCKLLGEPCRVGALGARTTHRRPAHRGSYVGRRRVSWATSHRASGTTASTTAPRPPRCTTSTPRHRCAGAATPPNRPSAPIRCAATSGNAPALTARHSSPVHRRERDAGPSHVADPARPRPRPSSSALHRGRNNRTRSRPSSRSGSRCPRPLTPGTGRRTRITPRS